MDKVKKIMHDGSKKDKQSIELKKIKVRYNVNNISQNQTSTLSKSQKDIKSMRGNFMEKQTLLPYGQSSLMIRNEPNTLSSFNKSQNLHKRSTSMLSDLNKISSI